MAVELDDLARRYKTQGFPAEGNALAAMADVFRHSGVPEQFDHIISEPLQEVPLGKLIEALRSRGKVEKGKQSLTAELAERINESFGGFLTDDVPLVDLRIPPIIATPGIRVREDINNETLRMFHELDPKVKASYTRVINGFLSRRFLTVGSIRNADLTQIIKDGLVGPVSISFMATALKPRKLPTKA